jgi:hypothetical protein
LNDTSLSYATGSEIIHKIFGGQFMGKRTESFFGTGWYLFLFLGSISLVRRLRVAGAAVIAGPILLLLLYLWKNPGYYLERYATPVIPIAAIVVVEGVRRFRHLLVEVADRIAPTAGWGVRGALAIVILYALVEPAKYMWESRTTTRRLTPAKVLDKLGAESLNNILDPESRVLVYEIQTQYFLEATAISADGIVRGEILPYLYDADIASFIRDYDITHVLVSRAFEYRSIYRGTILEALWKFEEKQRSDARPTIELGSLEFERLRGRHAPRRMPHWKAVYAVRKSGAANAGQGRRQGMSRELKPGP